MIGIANRRQKQYWKYYRNNKTLLKREGLCLYGLLFLFFVELIYQFRKRITYVTQSTLWVFKCNFMIPKTREGLL